MIEHLTRPLTESETRRIRAELARHSKRVSCWEQLKELLQVIVAVGIVGAGFSLFAKQPLAVALTGSLLLGVVLLCILWFERLRQVKPRIAALSAALKTGLVNVVHITSTGYATFSEYEDLGALYAFQISPAELFVLHGQEYYETEAFPCLEFELVDDASGAFSAIRPLSTKAAPVVAYTESEMLAVARIGDRCLLQGEVSNALSVLQQAVV